MSTFHFLKLAPQLKVFLLVIDIPKANIQNFMRSKYTKSSKTTSLWCIKQLISIYPFYLFFLAPTCQFDLLSIGTIALIAQCHMIKSPKLFKIEIIQYGSL